MRVKNEVVKYYYEMRSFRWRMDGELAETNSFQLDELNSAAQTDNQLHSIHYVALRCVALHYIVLQCVRWNHPFTEPSTRTSKQLELIEIYNANYSGVRSNEFT